MLKGRQRTSQSQAVTQLEPMTEYDTWALAVMFRGSASGGRLWECTSMLYAAVLASLLQSLQDSQHAMGAGMVLKDTSSIGDCLSFPRHTTLDDIYLLCKRTLAKAHRANREAASSNHELASGSVFVSSERACTGPASSSFRT